MIKKKKKSGRCAPLNFTDVTDQVLRIAAEIIDRQSKIAFYQTSKKISSATRGIVIKPVYRVYIKIRRLSNDQDILFLKHHFGGYYAVCPYPDGSGSSYWLSFQQNRCVKLMELVVPFLTKRKAAVESILRYYESKARNNSRRLTEEMKMERLMIYKAYKDAQRAYFESCQMIDDDL